MELHEVIPWGRTLDEYQSMFNLSEMDLQKNILGCADGPASFNIEVKQRGGRVTSIDPIYQFSRSQIEQRIREVTPIVLKQVTDNIDDFIWTRYAHPQALVDMRLNAMNTFLADYELGKSEQRYQFASLPDLDFPNQHFDLALCSNFLFLYSDKIDLDFHLTAIKSLSRVASEVRVYPLVTLKNSISPFLDPVIETLRAEGLTVKKIPVSYECQKNASHMLQIVNKTDD